MTYQVMCVGFASYYSMGSSYVRTREIVIGVITPQIAQHQLPTPGMQDLQDSTDVSKTSASDRESRRIYQLN
ncbi:hypothetical protein N7460_011988 [Penicillium canescens]|uniref:Uncharacterized protein n=1 Tax=Penicillium canescens TaxID=5083 RepID=A0AAD6I1D0_PENCN|nr:hypothetical protein N7460_011988 [Penicillium canescens]KAJ6040453.1 hypothetical protein N7444_009358 [Penicillium canescens]